MGKAVRVLAPNDHVLWVIERDPRLRSTVTVVGLLDRVPDLARLRTRLGRAAGDFERLRARIAEPLGPGVPAWVVDGRLDVGHHLRVVAAPEPQDAAAVLDLAAGLAEAGLDRARPLWHLTVVEGATPAFVLVFHHAMTDGVGAVHLAAALFDLAGDAAPDAAGDAAGDAVPSPASSSVAPGQASRAPTGAALAAAVALDRGAEAVGRGARVAAGLARLGRDSGRDPRAAVGRALGLARSAVTLLAPSGPPRSPIATGRGLDRAARAVDADLAALRAAAGRIAAATGVPVTVNDVFIGVVVGGLARYHHRHGAGLDDVRLHMPVDVRAPADDHGGNRFAPARFVVPATAPTPASLVAEVARIAHAVHHDPGLVVLDALAAALRVAPPAVTARVMGLAMLGVDTVVSNVPGSPVPLWLAGARVRSLRALVAPGGAGMNACLVSYAGRCAFGLLIDTAAYPDPDVVASCVAEELDAVLTSPEAPAPRARSARSAGGAPARVLHALDTAFLDLEGPTTPMHIGLVGRCDGAALRDAGGRIRIDDLRSWFEGRLDAVPRWRQRLVTPVAGVARPVWVDDEVVIERHVQVATVAAPGDEAALAGLFAELMHRPLPRDRPLWAVWFVDGLADGSVGIVVLAHHALVDGVSGIDVFARLFASAPGERSPQGTGARRRVRAVATALAEGAVHDVAELGRLTDDAVAVVRWLRAFPPVPRSSLTVAVGATRRYRAVAVPLARVAAGRARLRGVVDRPVSVNDVVLAAVTGGLRALLAARGELDPAGSDGRALVALIPKDVRRPDDRRPGNVVGALRAELPVGLADPLARLVVVHDGIRASSAADDAATTARLVDAADVLAPPLVALAARLVHHQPFVHVVVTNVIGPPEPLCVLGSRIDALAPMVPLGGNLSVGIAVLSYAGTLTVGVTADATSVSEAELAVLAEGIEAGFAELG